jgi:hypothetical protein
VCLELIGFGKYALEESVSLDHLDRVENIHGGASTDDAMEVLAVSAETVTVREKNQGVLPANEFATHRKDGTVRVHGALLVEHFDGSLYRVEDHDVLTQDLDMGDITWMQGVEMCEV